MSQKLQQIRITKTPEIQEALDSLRDQFPLMSDSELVKIVLSREFVKYRLTQEEEKSLEQAKKSKVGFEGSAEDAMKWLESDN